MLQGNIREGLVSYQLAWMNGVTDGGSADADGGDDKDLVARVFAHPFQESGIEYLQGLGLGIATTYGRQEGATPQYRTSGQQTFFSYRAATVAPAPVTPAVFQTGVRSRWSPQAYWYWGSFGLLGEYVTDSADYRRLTGENESYRGFIPSTSFEPRSGSWGGFEFISRYSRLRVSDDAFSSNFANPATSAQTADLWSVGINWYLNRFVKLALNYDHTSFDNFGANPDRKTEGVILSRVQLSY
jgi:phosphate-selective porin OprO/OprP